MARSLEVAPLVEQDRDPVVHVGEVTARRQQLAVGAKCAIGIAAVVATSPQRMGATFGAGHGTRSRSR